LEQGVDYPRVGIGERGPCLSTPGKQVMATVHETMSELDLTYGGPFMLDNIVNNVYQGGHTLWNLIRSHSYAQCKDPRDKIYGFIGLATDCSGFPMDYNKSLCEVWENTVCFVNMKEIVTIGKIAAFAWLVKELLGGDIASGEEALDRMCMDVAVVYALLSISHESGLVDD
jgi:hypothetical protein